MDNQGPRRQSLRNKLRLEARLHPLSSEMDIENPLVPDNHQKPQPHTQRLFGKDLTNGVLVVQTLSKAHHISLRPSNLPPLHPRTITTIKMTVELPVPQRKSQVSIYEDSISSYLHSIQKRNHPPNQFLDMQTEISQSMREVLVCWMIELHERFKLKEETLFKAVNIIDRYLGLQFVNRSRLQLLGVAAMYISCKYEEVDLHEIRKFTSVCGNTYSVQELLDMENKILVIMNFDMATISPLRLMELKCQMLTIDEDIGLFSEYLLQLCLVEYRMCQYQPTLMSLSAIYLSGKILNNKQITSSLLMKQFNVDQDSFKLCLKNMFQIYKSKDGQKYQALRRKYSRRGIE